MRTLRLVVEYDGTEFHGFQRQPARRTVQGVLEERFSHLLGEPIHVIGAGRTDAGVHATGQVVSFTTTRPVPVEKLVDVLNGSLPGDVKVQRCDEAPPDFHARRSARSRSYVYTLLERECPSPLRGRYALVVKPGLDVAKMAEAAGGLVGRRDFRVFQASGSPTKSTERTLHRLECARSGDCITVEVEADAFLYQMVRRLVGALVAVGRGTLETVTLLRAVAEPGSVRLPPPAPACGLCLVQVSYPDGRDRQTAGG